MALTGTSPRTAAQWTDAPPLPEALQVEVTSACNLRCAMCLVRYRPPINKIAGAMPLEMFQRLIDSVATLRDLTLQGLGEPLLSPHLLDMVSYAKARGVRVGFNSNATLLTTRKAAELIGAGLDWLHVSLDGASAGTYESIRDGATFDVVVRNLRGLVATKRRLGSADPWVRVVFVAMRRNVAELPDLVRLLAGIGVDELRVQNLSHDFSDTDPFGRYREIREFAATEGLWSASGLQPGTKQRETGSDADEAFARAQDAADEYGIKLRLPHFAPSPHDPHRPGCTWPWDAAYVTSQGIVQPCCMVMGDDRVMLGRLDEEDFATIWWGERYREFRRRLAANDPPEVCRGCALYQRTF